MKSRSSSSCSCLELLGQINFSSKMLNITWKIFTENRSSIVSLVSLGVFFFPDDNLFLTFKISTLCECTVFFLFLSLSLSLCKLKHRRNMCHKYFSCSFSVLGYPFFFVLVLYCSFPVLSSSKRGPGGWGFGDGQ